MRYKQNYLVNQKVQNFSKFKFGQSSNLKKTVSQFKNILCGNNA